MNQSWEEEFRRANNRREMRRYPARELLSESKRRMSGRMVRGESGGGGGGEERSWGSRRRDFVGGRGGQR